MSLQPGSWEPLFKEYRSYLVSFAFRMTGSIADAEDLVQETFLKCTELDLKEVSNPKALMTKICANKGLDYLKSARMRRETYPGTWLPDEIPQGLSPWDVAKDAASPEEQTLLEESLTTSFLLLLEELSPKERVVFLLNEILSYSFLEISELLGKKQDACRKIAERARKIIKNNQHRVFRRPAKGSEKILFEFYSHAKMGNIQKMVQLLSPNSELWGDGGGKVKAGGFLADKEEITVFFRGLVSSGIFNSSHYKVEHHPVNGRPGIIISKRLETGAWCFDSILSFEISRGQIERIYAQRNPDKLNALVNLLLR